MPVFINKQEYPEVGYLCQKKTLIEVKKNAFSRKKFKVQISGHLCALKENATDSIFELNPNEKPDFEFQPCDIIISFTNTDHDLELEFPYLEMPIGEVKLNFSIIGFRIVDPVIFYREFKSSVKPERFKVVVKDMLAKRITDICRQDSSLCVNNSINKFRLRDYIAEFTNIILKEKGCEYSQLIDLEYEILHENEFVKMHKEQLAAELEFKRKMDQQKLEQAEAKVKWETENEKSKRQMETLKAEQEYQVKQMEYELKKEEMKLKQLEHKNKAKALAGYEKELQTHKNSIKKLLESINKDKVEIDKRDNEIIQLREKIKTEKDKQLAIPEFMLPFWIKHIDAVLEGKPSAKIKLESYIAHLGLDKNKTKEIFSQRLPVCSEYTDNELNNIFSNINWDHVKGLHEIQFNEVGMGVQIQLHNAKWTDDGDQCLHEGDIVRYKLKSNKAGYLLLLNWGPSGSFNVLCPFDELFTDVYVEKDKEYIFPNDFMGDPLEEPFFQDHNLGIEHIWALVLRKPVKEQDVVGHFIKDSFFEVTVKTRDVISRYHPLAKGKFYYESVAIN